MLLLQRCYIFCITFTDLWASSIFINIFKCIDYINHIIVVHGRFDYLTTTAIIVLLILQSVRCVFAANETVACHNVHCQFVCNYCIRTQRILLHSFQYWSALFLYIEAFRRTDCLLHELKILSAKYYFHSLLTKIQNAWLYICHLICHLHWLSCLGKNKVYHSSTVWCLLWFFHCGNGNICSTEWLRNPGHCDSNMMLLYSCP